MPLAAGGLVLVVENDNSMREAIERLLGAAGFESAAYASAEALLADASVRGAVCVISDLRLPAMSGLDLMDEFRRRGGWPPVIVITAHDAPGVRAEAERHGAVAYLAKPFQGGALLDAIRNVADFARPH